jgi:hypothetical protein
MKTDRTLLLALLATAGAGVPALLAQSDRPPPPPHGPAVQHAIVDPVGVYDIDLEMQGQTTSSVLTISRDKQGKLTASFEVHGQTITLTDVLVDGRKVTMSAASHLTLTVTFKTDNGFSGMWERPDASGGILGIRRKS